MWTLHIEFHDGKLMDVRTSYWVASTRQPGDDRLTSNANLVVVFESLHTGVDVRLSNIKNLSAVMDD